MPSSDLLAPALAWSGYLRRRIMARPDLPAWLAEQAQQPVTPAVLSAWLAELAAGRATAAALPGDLCRQALRRLRERVFTLLTVRDLAGLADLEEVVGAMTALADLAVATAYRSAARELAETHGIPRDPATGAPQEMLIVGMGKLGGGELNVSSDIDLVMLYGEEGETDGPRPISHHEFYGRLTRRMMPMLSELDADGQVFRTDLRLRPDGDAGPLAWSLEAFEHYLIGQGREWERYAWLKARLIEARAWPDSQPEAQAQHFENLRRPFVYRKYFDFDALAALRALRERIRQDWNRRALARNGLDTANNIKLGDGGIREIEFVVQLSQMIRGGRMPALQCRGLIAALHAERDAGLIAADDADKLEAAYRFLRRTEHALQYREDEQTHLLPGEPERRAELAAALGFAPEAFEHTLAAHRAVVSEAFRNAFHAAGMGDLDDQVRANTGRPVEDASTSDQNLAGQIRAQFGDQADELLRRTEALLASYRMQSLPETSRRRVDALLPAALRAASRTRAPSVSAIGLLDLIEAIAQRSAYLALLAEYPDTLARVARITAASPWAAQYLRQHPLLLDSLIDWHTLLAPPDWPQIGRQLAADLDASLLPDGTPDVERQMNLMRDMQRQASFQLLAQDLEGALTVEQLGDQLSALADLLLAETLRRVWLLVNREPDAVPRFTVIAYGKLGGKELGYISDLDLVFLFDDPRDDAAEVYAKLGRRMSSWLSTLTSSGRLYDVDLRLRPDGEAGLLAVSVAAFEQYQRQHAWTWEHQALTRARYAAGDVAIGERFEHIRRDILAMPRDMDKLRREVLAMRGKISAGHPNPSGLFDLKHDRGGMVDVEFVTQYLVLSQSAMHPELMENLGNIALLQIAGEAGLIPAALAQHAGNAYRTLRRVQHELRLQGVERARVPAQSVAVERETVKELWRVVLG
ncbi:MAG TPA: bifunctional [glutamate--ammonia ligase]-adenylyl-L-tyrosine phosphorylase/[glutamate--ammonia-ligase] adenylyltransferase [Bordetella sp.]